MAARRGASASQIDLRRTIETGAADRLQTGNPLGGIRTAPSGLSSTGFCLLSSEFSLRRLLRCRLVPTAELVTALGVEPTAFGRDMSELGCPPRPGRVMDPDGTVRQVRGYVTADLRAAVDRYRDGS